MDLTIEPSSEACGATLAGVDLTKSLAPNVIEKIRAAWLEHHVLAFPDQAMTDDDLIRFTLAFGPFGNDPFIAPIATSEHIIAVHRSAEETGPIFAEAWHTDWSFQKYPPAGTCLFGVRIPTEGGDTLFANQHKALHEMPDELRNRLDGKKKAIHSARNAYARTGIYGEQDEKRSMDIRSSDDAEATQEHPIIRTHTETGREAVFGCAGYVVGIADMSPDESTALLGELYRWQTRPEFQYRHKWKKNMLIVWDNRSLLHMATGGYQGHERLLHRTTIGEQVGGTR